MENFKKYYLYAIVVLLVISNVFFICKSSVQTPVPTSSSSIDSLIPVAEKHLGVNIPLSDINLYGEDDYIVVSGYITKENAIEFLQHYNSYDFLTQLAMLAFPSEFFVSASVEPNDDNSLTIKKLNLGSFELDTNINLFSD